MDGKHISLYHPKGNGSEYYNYKRIFSLVMLPLVDDDYKFMFIDIGCQGRISDGDVYNNSSLNNVIEKQAFRYATQSPLPISEDPEWRNDHEIECFPFSIVGDAFPLIPQIIKPYCHRNLDDKKLLFNYRASTYRRVKENAFGILSCRFRLFSARTCLSPPSSLAQYVESKVPQFIQPPRNF